MRAISLVTSTRADYGIMHNLIDKLHKDPEIDFTLLVTGTHLSSKFGDTYKEIKTPISKKIDIEIEKGSVISYANAVTKFSEAFREINPDLVILLGDRFEIMAVAVAATLCNIPIVHLFGGDKTEGLIDEASRHSITKMSHLHFPSCSSSRKRVIQLGEDPSRVFDFGSLAIENIKNLIPMSKDELEKSLNLKFNKRNLLVTFHPVTLENDSTDQFKELLNALETLEDTTIIITCPNADNGNEELFSSIQEFQSAHRNCYVYKSLGMKRYFSCLNVVDAVVGNSSSGIYEVPSFHIPTVNIGNRQKGRLQAESVINCVPHKDDILSAIYKAYEMDCSNIQSPYEKPNTSDEIIKKIKEFNLDNVLEKTFYDIEF